jgi:hypothetical protein
MALDLSAFMVRAEALLEGPAVKATAVDRRPRDSTALIMIDE